METSAAIAPPLAFYPAEVAVLRLEPDQRAFDLMCANMRMSDGPHKGRLFRPDVSPFAEAICDVSDRPHVRGMYFIAPSQTTKTTIAYGICLARLHKRGGSLGVGMPDEKAARRIFKRKLHPLVESWPALKARLRDARYSLQDTEVRFVGDEFVNAMWAGSESMMSALPMPTVLVDESDAYEDRMAAGTMKERVTAYEEAGLSLWIEVSKPRGSVDGKDASGIWRRAKEEAQAWCHWQARCPACGAHQVMTDERIVSATGTRDHKAILRDKLGRYECEGCGWQWSDTVRNQALKDGRMVAVEGDMDTATVLAFHIRAWESTLVSLSTVLAKKILAQTNPLRMRSYANNIKAEPYVFVAEKRDEDEAARAIDQAMPPQVVPAWAQALTLFVDVQKAHFKWSVCAHAVRPIRDHVVDYGAVGTWDEVTQLLDARYRQEGSGLEFGIWRAAIDTGGTKHEGQDMSRVMQTYLWLQEMRRRGRPVFGTKGMSRPVPGRFVKFSLIEELPDGRKLKSGVRVYFTDGDAFKRLIFWRLSDECRDARLDGSREEEPIRFHAGTGLDYLREVTGERLELVNGKEQWVKFRTNDWLDCLVGHMALAHWQWSPSLAKAGGRAAGEAQAKAKKQRKPKQQESTALW